MSLSAADDVVVSQLADAIADRSATGIAAAINRLISSGRLVAGDRLPTVRELAAALGTSPATVAEAWRALNTAGAIVPRGRAGTFVKEAARTGSRYRTMVAPHETELELDLSTGVPSAGLLPDLAPAALAAAGRAATTSYLEPPVLPALEQLLRASWPYPPGALTVVDGALDAIDRVLRQIVRHGDHVAVENPTFPPFLDMLDRLGAIPVAVPIDRFGPSPSGLERALDSEPVAFLVQPRAQNPTGVSISAARLRALATVVRRARLPELLVIEDDHSGAIATAEETSFGTVLPAQTVHVRSYSKSHGPDLRIAAVAGPEDVVQELVSARQLGPGWTSRFLQEMLLHMLTDAGVEATVRAARECYAERRRLLTDALAEHGVRVLPGDGLALWVPVLDERSAMTTLAAAGVGVSPGSSFVVEPPRTDHVRVTIGGLPDDPPVIDEVARLLSVAAAQPPYR